MMAIGYLKHPNMHRREKYILTEIQEHSGCWLLTETPQTSMYMLRAEVLVQKFPQFRYVLLPLIACDHMSYPSPSYSTTLRPQPRSKTTKIRTVK